MAAPHKYETVQLHDPDHSESSTEVDESVTGEDAKALNPETQRSSRTRCTKLARMFHTSYRGLVDTLLLLVILGLLLRDQWRKQCAPTLLDIGGDYSGVRSEPFKRRIVPFVSDEGYMPNNTADFFTEETVQKWNKLMPKGIGFVAVGDTSKYPNLPKQSMDWGDHSLSVYSTSVTHSLHCLYAMAQTYAGISSGHPIPDDHHWHMIHCIDYMRNAIVCNADIALEGRETTFPEAQRGGSDGWDSTHICRDYDEVLEYLESVRIMETQTIY